MDKRRWTDQEIKILVDRWPHVVSSTNITELMRSPTGIDLKAIKIGLQKTTAIKNKKRKERYTRQVRMNKYVLGRDLSPENLHKIALQYSSKTEFLKKDNSAYSTARRLGILDEICKHMLVNVTYNFPQTFIFELMKLIYPGEKIRFNDRTAIHPKELDIYLPELRLGIEYDGKAFHNLKTDAEKNSRCELAGIKLIRIKEHDKRDPIPNIIEQLSTFFSIPQEFVESARKQTLSSFINKENIKATCLRYFDYHEFLRAEPKTVDLLRRNNFLEEMTSHMHRNRKRVSYNEAKNILLKAKTKLEVIKQGRIYQYLMKNKPDELMMIYSSLSGRSSKTGKQRLN